MQIPSEILAILILSVGGAFATAAWAVRSLIQSVIKLNTYLDQAREKDEKRDKAEHNLEMTAVSLNARIAVMEATGRQQQQQIQDLNTQLRDKSRQNEMLEKRLVELERQGAQKDAKIAQLETAIHGLETENTRLNKCIQDLQQENTRLAGERLVLVGKVDELTLERDSLKAELDNLRTEVNELKKRGTGPLPELPERNDASETPETPVEPSGAEEPKP